MTYKNEHRIEDIILTANLLIRLILGRCRRRLRIEFDLLAHVYVYKALYVNGSTHACTVPTFNSCTKCVGGPGILHDRTPD